MGSHFLAGTFVIMILSMVDDALDIQPPTPASMTEERSQHDPSASQVLSSPKDLHCRREVIPCIFPILMEQDPDLHFYILEEGSTEATPSALNELMQAAAIAGATATLVKREPLLTSLRLAVQGIGARSSIVIVLSTVSNITTLFKDVHAGSTADPKLRWLVMTKEDLSVSLEEIIHEETQVALMHQLSQGRHQFLASYINELNQVRFRRVGGCGSRVSCGCECSIEQPLFPSPLEVYQDFNGRQLLVATVNNVPYFWMQRRPDGTVESAQGVDYNVITTIGHFLNFTIRVVEPPDRKWGGLLPNGSVYGMVGLVARRLAHVTLNELTITVQRESVVDFTQPYIQEGTALVSRAPTEKDRSVAVFTPFSSPVWGSLITITLIMGLLSFLVSRSHGYCIKARCRNSSSGPAIYIHDNDSVKEEAYELTHVPTRSLSSYFFNMFRTLVLQGNLIPDDSSSIRVFLFTWYIFGIVMYALYAGNLTSFLTKPLFEKPIDTLQDLKDSTRRGFAPAVQPSTSQESLLKNAETGIFMELWELMDPTRSFPSSGLQAMERVLTEDIVYMSGGLNLEIRASQKGRRKFYISRGTFLPQLFGIGCFPGAPFKDKFSVMLGRMVQGGLIVKWVEDEVFKLRGGGRQSQLQQDVGSRSLALDHLQGAFIILAGGSLASTLFFLAEIIKHRAAVALQHT